MEKIATARRMPPGRALQVIAVVGIPAGKVAVSALLRARIEQEAEELWAAGSKEEISRTIARRLRVSERVVDFVLVGLMIQRRREVATWQSINANAQGMAAEAGEAVWEDVA